MMKRSEAKGFSWFFALLLTVFLILPNVSFAETDVTDKIEIQKSRMLYDRRTMTNSLDVSLKNISSDTLISPILVVINSISDPSVTVANSNGDYNGKPFFQYSGLSSSETSPAIKWIFNNPNRSRFSYSLIVIGTIETVLVPDCNGEPGGTATLDNCGECIGGNTGNTACAQDCSGVWGGTAVVDNCGECVGGNTGNTACAQDCNDEWGGTASVDNCGECVGGNTGNTACAQDCNGEWGGTASVDNCGECVGGNTGNTACAQDCNGEWGGTASVDNCGECVGGSTGRTACAQDCNGVWGGTASVDNCGECVGGNTGNTACAQDCNGEWGGTASVDNCGECVGGSTGNESVDSDNDGIPDSCDNIIDSDNDGVADMLDQCPETPSNESADGNGCSPSQIVVVDFDSEGKTFTIDDLNTPLQGISIEVPQGSFNDETTVTIKQAGSIMTLSGQGVVSKVINIESDPIEIFNRPIKITIPYNEAEIPNDYDEQKLFVIVQNSTGIEVIKSSDIIDRDIENNTITFKAVHFCDIAVCTQSEVSVNENNYNADDIINFNDGLLNILSLINDCNNDFNVSDMINEEELEFLLEYGEDLLSIIGNAPSDGSIDAERLSENIQAIISYSEYINCMLNSETVEDRIECDNNFDVLEFALFYSQTLTEAFPNPISSAFHILFKQFVMSVNLLEDTVNDIQSEVAQRDEMCRFADFYHLDSYGTANLASQDESFQLEKLNGNVYNADKNSYIELYEYTQTPKDSYPKLEFQLDFRIRLIRNYGSAQPGCESDDSLGYGVCADCNPPENYNTSSNNYLLIADLAKNIEIIENEFSSGRIIDAGIINIKIENNDGNEEILNIPYTPDDVSPLIIDRGSFLIPIDKWAATFSKISVQLFFMKKNDEDGTWCKIQVPTGIIEIEREDSDNDGIYDDTDSCPNTDENEVVDEFGCSEHQIDFDGDGIHDDWNRDGIRGDRSCRDGNTIDCDDNCRESFNPDQEDDNGNGVGDHCENLFVVPFVETFNIDPYLNAWRQDQDSSPLHWNNDRITFGYSSTMSWLTHSIEPFESDPIEIKIKFQIEEGFYNAIVLKLIDFEENFYQISFERDYDSFYEYYESGAKIKFIKSINNTTVDVISEQIIDADNSEWILTATRDSAGEWEVQMTVETENSYRALETWTGTDIELTNFNNIKLGLKNSYGGTLNAYITEVSIGGIEQPITWYKDSDGDAYSDGTIISSAYRPSDSYYESSELISLSGDWNDNNATVFPGAIELCDGIDNDGAGEIDEDCYNIFDTNYDRCISNSEFEIATEKFNNGEISAEEFMEVRNKWAEGCDFKVLGSIDLETSDLSRDMVFSTDYEKLYVLTQNNIYIINSNTNTVESTISLTDTGDVSHLAISPDNSNLYITDQLHNYIIVLDIDSKSVLRTIPCRNPYEILVTPNGNAAVVSNGGTSSSGEYTISIIDLSAFTVTEMNMPGSPSGACMGGPEFDQVLITTKGNSYVVAVDLENMEILNEIELCYPTPTSSSALIWPNDIISHTNGKSFYAITMAIYGQSPYYPWLAGGPYDEANDTWYDRCGSGGDPELATYLFDIADNGRRVSEIDNDLNGNIFIPNGEGENSSVYIVPEWGSWGNHQLLPLEGVESTSPDSVEVNEKTGQAYVQLGRGGKIIIIGKDGIENGGNGPDIDIESGLVSYYLFDNSPNDSFGNNHGTVIDGPVSYVNGFNGQAISFDGIDDYVQIDSNSTFLSDSFSVVAWVKRTGATSPSGTEATYIWSQWESGTVNDNFLFQVTQDDKLNLAIRRQGAGTPTHIYSTGNVPANQWVFVAVTYDGSTGNGTFYIEGQNENFSTGVTNRTINAKPIVIGKPAYNYENVYSQKFSDNELDELYYYNRVLSDEEIELIRN